MENNTYVIAVKNDVSSEDDIFATKAKDKEEALYNYARDCYSKDEFVIEMVEDRAINGGYWDDFFKNIFDFNMQEGFATDLTDDEIEVKFKENV